MSEVMGIDAGNYKVKVVCNKNYESFISAIGEWRQRTYIDVHSTNDMEFEISNKYEHYKGFAGPLANVESEYGGATFGDSKNHIDAYTRVLLAVWRNIQGSNVSIVVGQPYKTHTVDEKNDIIYALTGEHNVTVNGIKKTFTIDAVKVGMEGSMAFISRPRNGAVNLIDVGSGTVNCIHFLNKKIVDRKCVTLPFGSETSKSELNLESLANGIFRGTSALWNKNDTTLLCGGISSNILEPLKKYYPNIELLKPSLDIANNTIELDPSYANAVGMYIIGKKVFINA